MIKKIIIGATIFSLITITMLVGIDKKTVYAQEGAVSSAVAVPISTGFDLQSIMNYRKNFGLDLIATNVAKRILHSMSLDIVDWINSGFNGNPAFLSNPGGFFLDAADQVTGDFIFKNGLVGLCSPFEIDIKAALYMGQAGYETRYACTLGQIIDNTRNIGDNFYVNGSSINGFMGGDFTQGGWPAFIAMTTEPQNNPTGSYLKAKSELSSLINQRRAAINLDLTRGGGFLSWEECVDNPNVEQQAPFMKQAQYSETNSLLGGTNYSVSTSFNEMNKAGARTGLTKICETKTPGSVIAGSVNKSLGAGQDELVAADDINSIINALISTLAKTVLTGGLKGFGAGGGSSSNGNYSYNEYRKMIESDYNTNTQRAIDRTQSDTATQAAQIANIKSNYDKAVELITASKNKYLDARACYAQSSRNNNLTIGYIDLRISRDVDPLLSSLIQKQMSADALYKTSLNNSDSATVADDLYTIQNQTEASSIKYASLASITQSTVDMSITDLQDAVNKSSAFMADANRQLGFCQN